jgi:hypothetical protein
MGGSSWAMLAIVEEMRASSKRKKTIQHPNGPGQVLAGNDGAAE